MRIWPAIDLRGGRCVRLEQGDYDRETVFADDPSATARHWTSHGATCLHIVDLDAARTGRPINLEGVRDILAAVKVPCELGGGVRDEDSIRQWLDLGLKRLVVGTRALRDPDWFRRVCQLFPKKLALGIDARDGKVATDGWEQTSDVSATDMARGVTDLPVAAVIYTDIACDGMMQGPNLAAMEAMRRVVSLPLVASGGVVNGEDVRRLAELGMDGCIIGRALYEGRLTLDEAIAAAGDSC